MSSLLVSEREKYQAVWSLDGYGQHSPGEHMLPVFLDMSGASPGATVLDAGCGSGKGAVALRRAGMSVMLTDLTPDGLMPDARALPFVASCLWDDLSPLPYLSSLANPQTPQDRFDYVYCCDVMEHIPPAFTMLVIARLLAITKFGLFMAISTRPDEWGAFVGEALHHTVQSFVSWRDQIAAVGHLKEARDMLVSGCYYVEPKR